MWGGSVGDLAILGCGLSLELSTGTDQCHCIVNWEGHCIVNWVWHCMVYCVVLHIVRWDALYIVRWDVLVPPRTVPHYLI